jgi:hypothetical protein
VLLLLVIMGSSTGIIARSIHTILHSPSWTTEIIRQMFFGGVGFFFNGETHS